MWAVRDRGRLGTFASVVSLLIVAGVPITAAGIATGSGLLTVVGPVLLGTGVLSIAAITGLAIAPRLQSSISLPRSRGRAGWGHFPWAAWLLWISAAGVVVPMLLGVDYAISRGFPVPALDLRAMALIHGDLNALVFSLAGLLGWTLAGQAGSHVDRNASAGARRAARSAG